MLMTQQQLQQESLRRSQRELWVKLEMPGLHWS